MAEINKYQNGQIYKIVDNAYNLCYYGSTISKLCKRMGQHREHYRNGSYNCTVKKIFDTYGLENCKIELVENFPCDSRKELEAREGFYIKNNVCVNKIVAGRTKKAYREANEEEIKAYKKGWYEANKDQILAKQKAYKETHEEEIKAYKKGWYEVNKDKIKAYKKAYYETHKK